MSENKKINLASASDLKNNCDDHLGPILEYEYKQDFKLIDTKLFLTYLSIAISGLTFYLDKKFKNDFHNQIYYQLMVGLTALFYLFTLLVYLFSTKVQKDIKFVGVDSKQNKLTISTKLLKDYDPHYVMSIQYNDKSVELKKHFTELYNKEGFLQLNVFKKIITDQVNILQKSKN